MISPPIRALAIFKNAFGTVGDAFCMHCCVTLRQIFIMPSVAMNGGMPKCATRTPVHSPSSTPFIATLGMMKICRSVTQQCMQKASPTVPKAFLKISNARIVGEIILPILYWLALAVILHVVSKHTAFGRQVFAIGSNERTSKLSGVNVRAVKRRVYALMGALVAVTAVIQIARIGSMDYANAGSGYEMDAIAAVIIGGTSMSGGRGSVVGSVLGMLILAVMNNLLNLIGVPPFLREAFKGIIVIGAVLLQKKEKAS